MAEVNEIQRAKLRLLLALQNGLGAPALFRRNERDRILRAQAQVAGTVVRRQPEFDLGPVGGVPPMTRQNKTLLMLGQMPTLEKRVLSMDFSGYAGSALSWALFLTRLSGPASDVKCTTAHQS
jgi:hypothetical protein